MVAGRGRPGPAQRHEPGPVGEGGRSKERLERGHIFQCHGHHTSSASGLGQSFTKG